MSTPLIHLPPPSRIHHRLGPVLAACLLPMLLLAPAAPLPADDAGVFRVVHLRDLELEPVDGGEPAALQGMVSPDLSNFAGSGSLPWLRFGDGVEAYVMLESDRRQPWQTWTNQQDLRLAIRFSAAEPAVGFVDLSGWSPGGLFRAFRVTLDPADLEPLEQDQWQAARRDHHQRLADSGWPGAAWFRHLALTAADAPEPAPDANADRFPPPPPMGRDRGIHDTFAFFSGGRAVAENLALDQALFRDGADPGDMEVHALEDITGVTVREFDWTAVLADEPTALDALAGAIPFDQHVLFFNSIDDVDEVLAVFEGEVLPWLELASLVNRRGDLLQRYRHQLGIGSEQLQQIAPLVQSLALTGGDPYFDLGTDITIVMQSDQPERLFDELAGILEALAGEREGVEAVAAPEPVVAADVRWVGFQSPDRGTSTHLIAWDGGVALGNSPAGLVRLLQVGSGDLAALGSLEEFRFFRQRYRLDDDESALLFLSDATIRRWTGPEQRIGASRRSRALAALRDLAANTLAEEEPSARYLTYLGDLTPPADGPESNGGWVSSRWGASGFLHPLVELDLAPATDLERTAYETWRDRYEGNWSEVFDPIALRLTLSEGRREVDLSVIPLLDSTSYRTVVALAGAAQLDTLSRTRGDETLMLLSFAVDPDGEMMQQFSAETLAVLPGLRANPLGWMGGSLSLFLDRSMFWSALAQAEDPGSFAALNTNAIPVGMRVSVRNRLGLGLFMTAVKGFSEAAAPGLLSWQQREYDGQPYVSITNREGGQANELGLELEIHYAAMGSALLVTLSEEVLHRAIDREQTAAAAAAADDEAADAGAEVVAADETAAGMPVEHAWFEMDPAVLDVFSRLAEDTWTVRRRTLSWQALPILNEWHRRDPGTDAVAFHRRWMGEPLLCPGGRGYRWNPDHHTFESVAYGHPGAPRDEPAADLATPAAYETIGAGLHFDLGGLRARVFLQLADDDRAGAERLDVDRPLGEIHAGEGEPLAAVDQLWRLEPGSGLRLREQVSFDNQADEFLIDVVLTEVEALENGARALRFGTEVLETTGDWFEGYQNIMLLEAGAWDLEVEGEDYQASYQPPRLVVPPVLRAGAEFAAAYEVSEEFDGVQSVSRGWVSHRVVGLETVEVEAGTFTDCVRIDTVEIVSGEDHVTESRATTWYKPGLGPVKYEERSTGERFRFELVEVLDPPASPQDGDGADPVEES